MKIGAHEIGPGHPVFVVAELGVNAGNDVGLAIEMVHAAAEAGADAVKVAAASRECFLTETATYKGQSQWDMFEHLFLSRDQIATVAGECLVAGVEFFGTADCEKHAAWLKEDGAAALKIGSDDLTNTPMIRAFAKMGLPLIISTGMGTEREIYEAVKAVREGAGTSPGSVPDLALLVCTSLYPTPIEDAELWRIVQLRARGLPIGFSDHTNTATVSAYAVAAGACIVEKHFTLDRKAEGPDHSFSADPNTFALMVKNIREAESACHYGPGAVCGKDFGMRTTARRYIVAARDLPRGTVITESDIAYKRTGKEGLSPSDNSRVIGRRLAVEVKENEMLSEMDLV